jgi:hypothetical protein
MIRSTRTRDFQRQRVYDAELAALPKDTVGATLKEVQAYADKITGYAWFRRRWGARTLKVAAIRGSGGFVYDNSSTINIGLKRHWRRRTASLGAARDRPHGEPR